MKGNGKRAAFINREKERKKERKKCGEIKKKR